MIILIIIALLLLFGGIGYGYTPYRYHSWGIGGFIILVLLILLLTGNINI